MSEAQSAGKNALILAGYQIFHNYMRPHETLKGKTPAEACGIEVEGDNKHGYRMQANQSIRETSNFFDIILLFRDILHI